MMKKRIAILGSTGSIGTQTIDVLDAVGAEVAALTGNRNVKRMEEQVRKLRPKLAVLSDEAAAKELRIALADTSVEVCAGEEGLRRAATLEAIAAGKDIALANKETLVCAGELVMQAAQEKGVKILPVDSEHSAVFQCAQARGENPLAKIILTASGGPFFGKTRAELASVTLEQALRHPNWSMGAKITIDSATMFNKGLELIEAMWLYGLPPEAIDIVIHRESIVHSLIEFADGAVLAQLGLPDMRLPIQYALSYPERVPCKVPHLSLTEIGKLTFFTPDEEAFPALRIARNAAGERGTACAILNGANEAAVDLFLHDKIGFLEIPELVERALADVPRCGGLTLAQVLEADAMARETVYSAR